MVVELKALTETKGKLMGVDFGDVRTGIAFTDPGRILSSAHSVISPGGLEKTAQSCSALAKENRASAIVVGLPKNMDGTVGFRGERVTEFANRLAELVDVPVSLVDERLTTVSASHYLNETDTRGKKRKETIDALSAEIILESAVDRLKFLS